MKLQLTPLAILRIVIMCKAVTAIDLRMLKIDLTEMGKTSVKKLNFLLKMMEKKMPFLAFSLTNSTVLLKNVKDNLFFE